MISKNEKNSSFFCISWILAHLALLGFAFSFFQVFCFSFFIISFSFFSYFWSFSSISSWFLVFCSIFDQKMREMRWRLGKNWWVTSNHRKTKTKWSKNVKKKKIQKWNLFVAFFSTSAHLAFLGSDFSFFYHIFFIFLSFLIMFFDIFMDFFLVVQHFRPKDEKHVRIYRYIVTCVYFIFNDAHVSIPLHILIKRWIP